MRDRRNTVNQVYRGRRGGSPLLKALVVILAVLLLLGTAAILLLGRYVEYTDGGVRLLLPWAEEEKGEAEEPPLTSQELVITPTPTLPEEPARPEAPAGAVEVPVSAVLDGTAPELAGAGNAIVVTVKDLEGHLAWQSDSPWVSGVKGGDGALLNGDAAFSGAVQALGEDAYLVARVNCFCDLWMCVHDRSMILSTPSGAIWYDSKGMPWLSPASEDAVDYINGLCLELARMGFDEILLECAGFPESGRLSAVARDENYPEETLSEAVSQWLDGLAALLEEEGVALSIRAGRKDLDDCPSGRTVETLAGMYRVWLDESGDGEAWSAALAAASDAPAGIVCILSDAAEEVPDSDWARLEK